MAAVITAHECTKAYRAENPTPLQEIMVAAFEAVSNHLDEGEDDVESMSYMCETPAETDLVGLVLEDDGQVYVRIAYENCVTVPLNDLSMPKEQKDQVVALLNQLEMPKKTRKSRKVSSQEAS